MVDVFLLETIVSDLHHFQHRPNLGTALRTTDDVFTTMDTQASRVRVAAPIFCSFTQGWRQSIPEELTRSLSPPTPDSTTPLQQHLNDPRAPDPNKLHPTLSSWLRNMNTFSTTIDRLQELATTASQEHQPQLKRQVSALRTAFKKQQERYIAFLQLTKEYADRFLLDITEEIQRQSSFLDALERRLDMAKKLRKQAVDLRKSYEDGTLDCMVKVRRTGMCPRAIRHLCNTKLRHESQVLSQPLPQDIDLLKEVDLILEEIRQCYIEIDKFWVDEVSRVTRALKQCRLDPEDIERWQQFREGLEQTIVDWKV
jgi:hypothetical protein